jgi:hypothetical protein
MKPNKNKIYAKDMGKPRNTYRILVGGGHLGDFRW